MRQRRRDKQKRRAQRKARQRRGQAGARNTVVDPVRYDPRQGRGADWAELDDPTRLRRIVAYHNALPEEARPPDGQAHARMHLSVENRLHDDASAANIALAQLLADGMSRHQALHAIAFVMSRHEDASSSPEDLEHDLRKLNRESFDALLVGLRPAR
ncbi:MAG: hypothetical protein AAGA56_10400 [Myxococcota bacterium]